MKSVECIVCGSFFVQEDFFCRKCADLFERSLRLEREEGNGYYIYRVFYYDELIRSLIHRMKFKDQPYLSEVFSYYLQKALVESCIQVDCISFIPMYFWKKWVRGYDPAEDLAYFTAKRLKVPFGKVLVRRRWTKELFGLNKKERRRELKDVFTGKDFSGNLLVIDDVMTTGTTIEESAKALRKGTENFSFLTLV